MPLSLDTPFAGGNYRILKLLGAGASGEVYLATERETGRSVALKVFLKDAAGLDSAGFTQMRERFAQEAELGKTVQHPNVIRVYASGEADGLLYLSMQVATGGSVAARIRIDGPLPIKQTVRWLLDAARGLAALHDADVIHRDVKPSNLLLMDDGRVAVADLGLAQLADGQLSQRASVGSTAALHPGTPDYMSPEHASPRTLLPTSDVYSLGCVAFEMLTGKRYVTVQSKVRGPSELRAEVPVWLDTVVRRMVSNSPGLRPDDLNDRTKRYVSMTQVIEALDSRRTEPAESTSAEGSRSKGSSRSTPVNRTRRTLLVGGMLLALAGAIAVFGRSLWSEQMAVVSGFASASISKATIEETVTSASTSVWPTSTALQPATASATVEMAGHVSTMTPEPTRSATSTMRTRSKKTPILVNNSGLATTPDLTAIPDLSVTPEPTAMGRPSISDNGSSSVSVQPQPELIVTTPVPEPICCTTTPQSDTPTPTPDAIVTTPAPEISCCTPTPEVPDPITITPVPELIVTTPAPDPITITPAPERIATTPAPEPIATAIPEARPNQMHRTLSFDSISMPVAHGSPFAHGKYRIQQLLGVGASSEVYLALEAATTRTVALKVLVRDASGLDSGGVTQISERFVQEAELGMRLRHPNVVEVQGWSIKPERSSAL